MLTQQASWKVEIVPDSEDEPQRLKVSSTAYRNELIEISSSSDGEEDEHDVPQVPGAWKRGPGNHGGTTSHLPSTPSRNIGKSVYMRSRVIESSDSETSEKEATSSRTLGSVTVSQTTCKSGNPSDSQTTEAWKVVVPTFSKDVSHVPEDVRREDSDDGAILVFDEPKSARKPIPSGSKRKPITPSVRPAFSHMFPHPEQSGTGIGTPGASVPGPTPKKRGAGTPRTSKKKTREEEQAKLHDYATSLFKELNRTVFNDALPQETKLNWNKRLLTTAGRAKWHRSRDGVQTSEIELAEKILTSCERIRNTLSHEMCHLASWVIDKEVKEGHGKFWKAWTRRVMAKYPNIDISTRHDYDIEYPYQWKCAKCAKIYGRFSKSIKPDECVCGACREGRLIPLFSTSMRTSRTPRISRMAATKGQDSPCPSPAKETPAAKKRPEVIYIISDSEDDLPSGKATTCGIESDGDDEIEVLALTLKSTFLSHSKS